MNNEYVQNHFGLGVYPQNPSEFDELFKFENFDKSTRNFESSQSIIVAIGEFQKNKKMKGLGFEKMRKNLAQLYDKGIQARANLAIMSKTPFLERMVWFWSNHFAISVDNIQLRALAASYEFEAIRPNILGSFHDLLTSSITHPAMLVYLNQFHSVGPNSKFALQRKKGDKDQKIGINENLAREILELHTLGVHGGYTQNDVTEFAKAMTGLTIMNEQAKKRKITTQIAQIGQSYFEPVIHEPGSFNVLGKTYSGDNSVFEIIDFIAKHPSTAANIATKLAKHFAGDNPPKTLIERLKKKFLETNGDLKSLYKEILNAPECFAENSVKFKNPWEWLISALRLTKNPKIDEIDFQPVMNDLGMNIWQPGSPKGFDDFEDAWASPNSILHRVKAANIIGSKFEFPMPATALAKAALGDKVSKHTLEIISRAESPMVGYALLMVSPEFLRR